jgi:hypothetical protein
LSSSARPPPAANERLLAVNVPIAPASPGSTVAAMAPVTVTEPVPPKMPVPAMPEVVIEPSSERVPPLTVVPPE